MNKLVWATLGACSAASLGVLVSCSAEEKAAQPTASTQSPSSSNGAASTPPAAQPAAAPSPLTVERRIEGSVRARVRAVDYATRQVTLEDDQHHSVTFIAGPNVRRLNEVHAGDYVAVKYEAVLTAELRQPTAEEAADPIAAVNVTGRAGSSSAPAAAEATGLRVVTTVQAIDIPNMRVTLQGPMGDQTTVKARSEENIKRLKIGDTIVITYVEAMAVGLERASR